MPGRRSGRVQRYRFAAHLPGLLSCLAALLPWGIQPRHIQENPYRNSKRACDAWRVVQIVIFPERHKMAAAESCEVGIACTAEAQAPGQDDVERGPRGSMLNQE